MSDATGEASSSSSPSDIINIRIKTMNDREFDLAISPNAFCSELRDRIQERLGIDGSTQRIIFQGRVLSYDETIGGAGIQDGFVVHVAERPPGVIPMASSTSAQVAATQRQSASRSRGTPNREHVRRVHYPDSIPPPASMRAPMQTGLMSRFHNMTIEHGMDAEIRRFQRGGRVVWKLFLEDTRMFNNRREFETVVLDAVRASLSLYMPNALAQSARMSAEGRDLRIILPTVPPHIASPALEKLLFVEMYSDQLERFMNLILPTGGLVDIVGGLLDRSRRNIPEANLDPMERERLFEDINRLIITIEQNSREMIYLPSRLDIERVRQASESELALRIEEVNSSGRHYFMRHALDIDLISAQRKFRQQQRRFLDLEDLLDDVSAAGTQHFVRREITSFRDYRNLAISAFYHYVTKMRHMISHTLHVMSELDISFLSQTSPHRLLPQYALNNLQIPEPHSGTLVLVFRAPVNLNRETVDISTIFHPPRADNDVLGRAPRDWPFLRFYPAGLHADSVERRPDAVAASPPPEIQVGGGPRHIEQLIAAMIQQSQNGPNIRHNMAEVGGIRRAFRSRTVGNDGGVMAVIEPVSGTIRIPLGPVATSANNPIHTARGPENNTMAPFPVTISPTELHTIAHTVATRFRDEAVRRIANQINLALTEQSWETRLTAVPLCALREMLSLALELMTSAGSTMDQSKEMMLALIRDEAVLVKAIVESLKSLFGRGEFPTHLYRLICPRIEPVGSRPDYESDSDEYDNALVRVPSDVTQPQSGSLRAIAEQRANRRRINTERLAQQNERAAASTNVTIDITPNGPTFDREDQAEVRAGRLPTQPRATGPDRRNRMSLAELIASQLRNGNAVQQQPHVPAHSTTRSAGSPAAAVSVSVPAASATSASPVASSPQQVAPPRRGPTTSADPIPMEVDMQPVDPGREARRRIDMMASLYNGHGVPDLSIDNASTLRQNAMPAPTVTNRSSRTTVPIDPFLCCSNRHNDANRLPRNIDPQTERFTMQSLQPNPEFFEYLENLLMPIESLNSHRPDDDGYNFSVTRYRSGEIHFEQTEDGQAQFMRTIMTGIRSLYAHLIDTDSIISLNSIPVSGHPAPHERDLDQLIERHLNPVVNQPSNNFRFSENGRPIAVAHSTRRQNVGAALDDHFDGNDEVDEDVLIVDYDDSGESDSGPESSMDVDSLSRRDFNHRNDYDDFNDTDPLNRRNGREPEEYASDVRGWTTGVNPGDVAMALGRYHGYLRGNEGQIPPGLYGLIVKVLKSHLSARDFGCLINKNNAIRILNQFKPSITNEVFSNILRIGQNQNDNLSANFVDRNAKRYTSSAEFYYQLLCHVHGRNELKFTTRFGDFKPGWVLHVIELDCITSLIKHMTRPNDSQNFGSGICEIMQLFFARFCAVFRHMAGNDVNQHKSSMELIAGFVQTQRRSRTPSNTLDLVAGVASIMRLWFELYKDTETTEVLEFIKNNPDATNGRIPSSSASSTSSTVGSKTSHPTSPKRPRFDGNDDDDIDIGVEATEDTVMDTNDGPSSSSS